LATILEEICENIMFLIGDAIIVWRAWAIWAESQITRFCLIILLLVDIGINIADAVVDARVSNGDSVTLDWIYSVMNLVVNIIATLLIVYQAWRHHKSLRAVSRSRKTPVQAILLLLIESGAIFASVQVFTIIILVLDVDTIRSSSVHILGMFVAALYPITSALIPVAIVILVKTNKTYEYSLQQEDESSSQVQSIDLRDRPPGIIQ